MEENNQAFPMQEVPVSQDEVYAHEIQQQRVANIIEQTSPEKQLEEIEWRIKGYKRNTYTRKWEKIDKDVSEPSSLLISRYISTLSSVLNENTRFTNLSGSEITSLMEPIIEWLVDDLDSNSEEYGLGFKKKVKIKYTDFKTGKKTEVEKEIFKHDYAERTRIGHIILRETFIVLKRAQNGMESRRIFKALSLAENLTEENKKSGFMNALQFWKQ